MPIDRANADLLSRPPGRCASGSTSSGRSSARCCSNALQLAVQAPTASNGQTWRWMVVTDPDLRLQVADHYRAAGLPYLSESLAAAEGGGDATQQRVYDSAMYLAENMEKGTCPGHPLHRRGPCRPGPDGTIVALGSIVQAAWSFQLALRARGLGSTWTTLHLRHAAEVGELLGIPDGVTQVSLIPVALHQGAPDLQAGQARAGQRDHPLGSLGLLGRGDHDLGGLVGGKIGVEHRDQPEGDEPAEELHHHVAGH